MDDVSKPHALLDEVYAQLPFTPVRGAGVFIEDAHGTRLLDLYGGHAVAALGYAHPKLTAAIERQAAQLVFQTNAVPLAIRSLAAEKLAGIAPASTTRVFLVNSGTEANENALRLAIKLTGRTKVVALEHGFHGRTAAAGAVTHGAAQTWYGFPRTPFDVEFVPRDDADALARAVDSATAAVILEPVQGLAGAYDLSSNVVRAARAACDARGALLIADEVQCGMGRTGRAFAIQGHGVEPDLLTTAKGLGGGFPVGALLTTREIASGLKPGELGTTFGGGPLAAAAIVAVVDALDEERLLENVRRVSAYAGARCMTGPVTGIQGAGFLLGLRTKPRAAEVRDALLERGILAGTSADAHVLRLLPPLILAEQHVDMLIDALGEL